MNLCRMALWILPLCCLAACGGPPAETATSATAEDSRFEERYVVTADSIRLYVRTLGSGPDTIIIPGAMYLAQDLVRLTPGRTLVLYDPRSRGASDAVLDPLRSGVEREVTDMEEVRAGLGIDRASIIGWSYLGAVVALYAADHPEHVRSVVQIGPMAPRRATSSVADRRGSPPDSADLRYLADLEEAGLPSTDPVRYCREFARIRLIQPMMGHAEGAARTRMDPCLYWNEWPTQLFATLGRLLPPDRDWDYTERAARVQAPVLTIHGTNDPNAPVEGGREWASLIPNARLLELQGVGHAPWLEAPEEFFTAVDAFLREHWARQIGGSI